jgi:hypothetical protein
MRTQPATVDWDVAAGTGLLRIGVGVSLLRWPHVFVRLAGGASDDRALRGLFRYFGARDVALGVAALAASRPGGDVRRQLVWQGVADTVDGAVVAGLVRRGRLTRVQGIGATAVAAGSALAEFALAWRLGRRTD